MLKRKGAETAPGPYRISAYSFFSCYDKLVMKVLLNVVGRIVTTFQLKSVAYLFACYKYLHARTDILVIGRHQGKGTLVPFQPIESFHFWRKGECVQTLFFLFPSSFEIHIDIVVHSVFFYV